MHAFLVSEPPDIPENTDTLHLYPETSIGIAEIRKILSFLSRKPISAPENTVIVHDADLLTLPAQNAFLKTLEEPPPNSLIYLVTSQPDLLLPTILSRVRIISGKSSTAPAPADLENSRIFLEKLLSAGVGERLSLVQNQNFTRESALEFLDHIEHILHDQITKGAAPALNSSRFSLIHHTRDLLKSNVNLSLALGHLAIHIEPSS